MSSSSSEGTHSLRFYNSRKHSKPITARYSRQQLFGRCCTGKLEALGSEKASRGRKAFSLRRAPIRFNQPAFFWSSGGLGFVGILLYFRARVYPRSGRSSGDPSGRGHAIVPRGRTWSVLPACASLAHSDPLVVSSIAFCRALHRVRRSWGRYNRPQEWTLGSEPRVVAVKPRAALLLPDGTSCLVYSSVSVLCRSLPYAT